MTKERAAAGMEKYYSTEHEYLVFACGTQLFSLPYAHLVTVVDSPVWTPVPNAPSHVRGVIKFHGKSIPFYDCRVKAGLESCQVETGKTIEALKQRKEDHINWINRLKDEVHGEKGITVQTDHHKCAFGMWYDAFASESPNLRVFMERFDEPHQRIHKIAIEAKELMAENRIEEAKRLIASTENTLLRQLINLFDSAEEKIRKFSYEYGIVIEYPGWDTVAISADSLKRFERFDEVIHPLPAIFSRNALNFIDAIGRQNRSENDFEEVLIINLEKFLTDDLKESPAGASDLKREA